MAAALSGNEDNDILQLVRELCVLLSVRFQPSGVSWMANLGHPLHLPSDNVLLLTKGPRRGFLVVPTALKEKLVLDDWKPIFISAMLLQLKPNFQRYYRTFYALLIFTLIFSLIISFLLTFLGYSFLSLVFFLFTIVAWFLLPRAYNHFVVRGTRLSADKQAAKIVGPQLFIRTLEKIDGFKILDLEERKQTGSSMWRRRVSVWPTISERLANLRKAFPY
jgi:hypothetical protein